MDPAIHGVNSFIKKFNLSNYSLTSQILIINLLTAIIGLFFLIIFNFYLIYNDQSIDGQINDNKKTIIQITDYLEKGAILRVRLFNEACEESINKNLNLENQKKYDNKKCEDVILSEPQLDPTITQKYIEQNYLHKNIAVKIFNNTSIKYADTLEMYKSSDVVEIEIENIKEQNNYYILYKNLYLDLFKTIQDFFIKRKLKSYFINYKDDLFVVKETIEKELRLTELYLDSENNINQIISNPILKNNSVYGVVLISSILNQNVNQIFNTSFNLINLYFVIIFIMFLSSVFFSRSLVSPIKLLSRITRFEREKINRRNYNFIYPKRKDEIGILGKDIFSMSQDLKKRIDDLENFAGDVSHELKNPLSSLKSSSELLIQNKITENNKHLLIKNMIKDIERMNILISDISNYTLTQVEISEEALEKIELINFLYEFKNSLSSRNLIQIINDEKEIYIKVNKNKFIRVLHNLLDNAFSLTNLNSRVLMNITIKHNECLIHIVDQGPGISLEYNEKIFERFYTDRDKHKNKHSGLGLCISRNIIDSFDGNLKLIKSTYSGFDGACFEIKLPLKDLKKI